MSTIPLQRSIGFVPATAMVVGTIIGASIFVQPSAITASVPSVGGVVAAWLAAGLLTLFGALVAAELGSAYPRSGGVYVFLREAFGPATGFLWGWAMFWSMHTGILAAIAVVFARYLAILVPAGPLAQRVAAVAAILVLSAVNYAGVRAGSRVQTLLTALKVGAVVGLVALAFLLGHPAPSGGAAAPAVPVTLTGFLAAVGAGLFAFGGWHMVTYAAEETVEPERTIPRALRAGVLIVTACYVALNAAYLRVLPLEALTASRGVAADAAQAVIGGTGRTIAAAVVVVSALGALNGIILAGPRVYFAMAQDGLLFRWAAAVHPRFRTPHRAIALQGLWASALVATSTYEGLFSRVVAAEWLFFGAMALGLLILRRRPDYNAAYRVAGFPAAPLLFAAAALAVAAGQIAAHPRENLIGIATIAAGWPVYALWARRPRTST